jgi:hypothetical protein
MNKSTQTILFYALLAAAAYYGYRRYQASKAQA